MEYWFNLINSSSQKTRISFLLNNKSRDIPKEPRQKCYYHQIIEFRKFKKNHEGAQS